MTKFKFFRGYIGTLDLMDGQTYPTASIYNPNTLWTPEEFEEQRIQRMRIANDLSGIITHEQYMRNRDMMIEQERIRRQRMVEHSRQTDEQIRLFQATTTITVNPTLWTKVKMFGTGLKLVLKATWRSDPMGVIVMTLLSSVVTFIGIMKLFGA
jgi:hypothetical protein